MPDAGATEAAAAAAAAETNPIDGCEGLAVLLNGRCDCLSRAARTDIGRSEAPYEINVLVGISLMRRSTGLAYNVLSN